MKTSCDAEPSGGANVELAAERRQLVSPARERWENETSRFQPRSGDTQVAAVECRRSAAPSISGLVNPALTRWATELSPLRGSHPPRTNIEVPA